MPSWTKEQSQVRVKAAIADVASVEISDLTRETDLRSIPLTRAYRVDGVHVYADIPNVLSLLETGASETERAHKRCLRFLHVYQRVAKMVFDATDIVKVDFQNQRLHAVVYKPYDSEKKRIAKAVALADVLRRVLLAANDLHDEIPDARMRSGIESGISLAVNNGTRGDREPLFLGDPANVAAKMLPGGGDGTFLGPNARSVLGDGWTIDNPELKPLTSDQIEACTKLAALDLDVDRLTRAWAAEVKENPISEFLFQRPTPPLKDLPLDDLTPSNSRRIDGVTVVADIDGFTQFVREAIAGGQEEMVVRALHVARKELRDVLVDFGARKIRYVGDAVIGVLAEGDQQTDRLETVTSTALLVGALRDAFGVIKEELTETKSMGLAIGFELGPLSITRLGVRGSRDRCMVGTALVDAEGMQHRCKGDETGAGASALDAASAAVRMLFETPIQRDLTYNKVVQTIRTHDPDAIKKRDLNSGPTIIVPRAHAVAFSDEA